MNQDSSHETSLNTATILDHAKKRQEASQLLLLAIVDKNPRSISDIRNSIQPRLKLLRQSAREDFYFDLGWLETTNTILEDFVSLNWVEKHHSTLTYQSTKIGKAALIEQWQRLQPYFGTSLESFQEVCQV